jgi:hypothetical protein
MLAAVCLMLGSLFLLAPVRRPNISPTPVIINLHAPLDNEVTYQGVLKLNDELASGTYDMVFSLWDKPTGGIKEWGDETHAPVPVSGGLFTVVLGETLRLAPRLPSNPAPLFDEQLYLQIAVDGATLSPRQKLRPGPYALGLVAGAGIKGAPIEGNYALTVVNTGTTGTMRAIYASTAGTGNVAIVSPDFVHARGYRSDDDSYIWTPATAGFSTSGNVSVFRTNMAQVTVRNTSGTDQGKYFVIPVTLPSVLYGTNVTVEELTVYYATSDPASYISTTQLYITTGVWTNDVVMQDLTDRKSTHPTSYSVGPYSAGLTDLGPSVGLVTVLLEMRFADTNDTITVGGVRLRLGHKPAE